MTHPIACGLVLILLPLLAAAEEAPRPRASLVSLDGRERTLAQAAAELARQANVSIDTSQADADRRVNLRLSDVPLWEALDRLARAADQRLSVGGQGARIAFNRGPFRSQPVSINGAFRFAARGSTSRLVFESGVSVTEVPVEMAWEPSFKPYYYEVDPASVVAVDPEGRSLSVVNEGASRQPVGTGTPELTVKLRGVPRSVPHIGRLEGIVKFLGTSQMLQFSFPLADEKPMMKRGEVTGTLTELRKNVRLWTAVVDLQYPDDMPKFESFQSFLLDNEAWLLRGDGMKFPVKKYELGFERGGKVPITFYIPESDKDGLVLGERKDWKLVVRVPGRIVEEKVPFRLQDVPLP